MAPETFEALLLDAKEARARADRKKKEFADVLLAALCEAIPEGTVVDRSGRAGEPECVLTLSTTGGSDRGTSLFRICRILFVDANVDRPGLSRWSCEALPISKRTGSVMSPKAGNSRFGARDVVQLTGYVLADSRCMSFGDQVARVAELVAGRPARQINEVEIPDEPNDHHIHPE